MSAKRLGMIGYGEVGSIFCAALREHMQSTLAWDFKLRHHVGSEALRMRAECDKVPLAVSMAAMCADSDIIFSAVTASNTCEVAEEAALSLRPGTIFVDLNSASPGVKQHAARVIEAAGGLYGEAGVMSSVPPHGIRVPMLMSGPQADIISKLLCTWGMDVRAISSEFGTASAIKMCRSIIIKGLEALVLESYATARAYGVERHVLPTLDATFPGFDWETKGDYFYSRVRRHGKRRAEEMCEAAGTVREAGFEPVMSNAVAAKQGWMAKCSSAGLFDGVAESASWQELADRLIADNK